MAEMERRLGADEALRVLADGQRRAVVRRLAAVEHGTTLDGLAGERAGVDDVLEAPSGGGMDAAVALHHVHLPMLDDANVLSYDAARGTVRRDRSFEDVRSLLDLLDGEWADGARSRGEQGD